MINLAGEVAPFLVALVALPIVIRALGVDRYGVLTLSMMVVGYFGLFDLGLGRAATKFIAEAVASSEQEKIPDLFWTSLFLMLAFGAAGSVLVAALAPWLVYDVLKIPSRLRPESLHAFYLLALSMPFVISGGSLGGTLSALQRFDLINAVRVPSGIFSYVGPLLVLPFSHSLGWLVAMVVAVRLAGWFATLWLCFRAVPALRREIHPRSAAVRPMVSFGSWITVSTVIGPIMAYFDRFLIGAMLSMAAVAYYAVPFQVAGKLGVVSGAMEGVIFAAFSGSFARNPARATLIFERATRYTLLALFVPVLLLVALAPEGLAVWLGHPFAAHSAGVLRWLAVGTFVNCLASAPYGLVQAAHRPDLTAKLHVAEVPFYLALLWWMLPRYGIVGAAIAWTARVTVEIVFLLIIAHGLLPLAAPAINRLAKMAALALVVLGLGALPMDLAAKGLFLAGALGSFALLSWTVLLDSNEKAVVRGYLHSASVPAAGAAE